VTLGATTEAGEPRPLFGSGTGSVWFTWTAPASGRAWVSTRGTVGEHALGVYTGGAIGSLTTVGESQSYYPYYAVGFDATAGVSYRIQVLTWGGSAEVNWSVDTQAGAPARNAANDMFANAWTIVGSDVYSYATTTYATKEPGEPNHAGNAGGHSVWWTWTAPNAARAVISSTGFNTLLGVYTGASVSALALVAANDDDGSTVGGSTVTIDTVAGATYRIAVDGKNGVTGDATLHLLTSSPADTTPPSTTITTGPSSPTSSPSATFTFWSDDAVRFECSLDGGAFLACSSPAAYSGLLAGPHSFAVRGIDAAANVERTPAMRSWTVTGPPANDAFATAAMITGLTGLEAGTTTGATHEPGEPRHSYEGGAGSVWYRWTPPRDGIAAFWLDWAPSWPLSVAVYTGTTVASLQRVVGLDGGSFFATAGSTYVVAVDGAAANGSFKLRWRDAPTNDQLERAGVVGGESGTWRGDNIGATKTEDEPAHGGDPGGASVWLSWTAPRTGTVTFDTLGSDGALPTVLAVYTRDFGRPLELRGQDRDSAGGGKSSVSLGVLAQTRYLVAVDGVGGATGAVHVNWSLTATAVPPPPTSTTAPAVALTAPADGAHVSGTARLAATASDAEGIDRVEFVVGGRTIGFDRDAPYSYDWDTTTSSDGPVAVKARAVDRTGTTAVAAARTVTVDNTAPWVTIDDGPYAYGTVATAVARFAFHAEPGARFECSLDGSAFSACTSPADYFGVAPGFHRWAVHAVDRFGAVGDTQTWSWTTSAPTDASAPETTIDSGPSGTTSDTGATFFFSAGETNVRFQCRLDAAPFSGCETPLTLQSLPSGSHTFQVRAFDVAGNLDPTPAARTWTISTSPGGGAAAAPDTAITTGPSGLESGSSATFAFTATSAAATFECALDAAAFVPCTTPRTYTGLTEGAHTFRVRGGDAGGVDPTPATRTWTIDTTPPGTTITDGPSGTVSSPSAAFGFTSDDPGAGFRCSLDDAPFVVCSSPKPFSLLAPGSHTFAVRAVDAAGNADMSAATRTWTISPPADPSGGLLPNGSFEGSTAGWSVGGASVSVVAGGKVGSSAARVSWAAGDYFYLGAVSPPPVAAAVGARYELSGWVRSQTAGQYVCLVLQELDGAVGVRQTLECLTTSTDWRQWPTVALTPTAGHQLYVFTISFNAKPGDSYDIDGLTLTTA